MTNKIFTYIGKSITKDGKVSSTRVSSYFILGAIVLISIIFASIEVVNSIIMWKTGMPYTVPGEHIAIFGMILTHHLALLGINKAAETKVEQAVQDKMKSHNQINPKDMPTKAPDTPFKDMEEGPSDADMV
jgi:hypothetical protein